MTEETPPHFACKDCKFSYVPFFSWFYIAFFRWVLFDGFPQDAHKCRKYQIKRETELNDVLGEIVIRKGKNRTCFNARYLDKACSPQGNGWEPRKKKDLFKVLMK